MTADKRGSYYPAVLQEKGRIDANQKITSLQTMKSFTAVLEKCSETGLYVGYVPGFPGAHSQGETLDELRQNLEEVISMLLEDGDPEMSGEFVGTQTVAV